MQPISINIPQPSPTDIAELHRAIADKNLSESKPNFLITSINNCRDIVNLHTRACVGLVIGLSVGLIGDVISCIIAYSSDEDMDFYRIPFWIQTGIAGSIIGEASSRIRACRTRHSLEPLLPPPAYETIELGSTEEAPLPPHYDDVSFSDEGSDSEELSDTSSMNSLLSTVTVISECN